MSPAEREFTGPRVLGTGKDWETEAFKKDVAGLPDISTLEEYAAMPVESFGEAMLRGMGWSEEKETQKVVFTFDPLEALNFDI